MTKLYLFLAILCGALAAACCFFNQASVTLHFFSGQWNVPLYAMLAKGYVLGAATIFFAYSSRRKVEKVEQKKLEWKTEDAKLQTEIQSDKVHQLELQVKTLESALDKALKRSKS
jgi:uncharacterized integral membrane protein